ncbi:hypothetical protein SJAG_00967 [Schizosaccharomyces japonicus yFS275]|uniref:Uncharacterized protein n=1 Tax=Schizosaccharomyces japonicus (strain yFS275 / FY16936) TaxID=402676 RepID=B6JX40_SCHJY|nr:hypothetical protein SJAG_00967 [Schizosaccharomyces japonicus yFS275]EEB05941.2 hypothetical protein SJAG_00967 [Schizosaccharomyces japonicus yFS275]
MRLFNEFSINCPLFVQSKSNSALLLSLLNCLWSHNLCEGHMIVFGNHTETVEKLLEGDACFDDYFLKFANRVELLCLLNKVFIHYVNNWDDLERVIQSTRKRVIAVWDLVSFMQAHDKLNALSLSSKVAYLLSNSEYLLLGDRIDMTLRVQLDKKIPISELNSTTLYDIFRLWIPDWLDCKKQDDKHCSLTYRSFGSQVVITKKEQDFVEF